MVVRVSMSHVFFIPHMFILSCERINKVHRFILNFSMIGSKKLKRIQIDKYVLEQFKETRRKRLPVKDFTLQQWAMEINDKVNIKHVLHFYQRNKSFFHMYS